MKKLFAMFVMTALSASVAFGQSGMLDITAKGTFEGTPEEGPAVQCEDLGSLMVGLVDGQTSANGNTWLDPLFLGAEVIDGGGGDLLLQYTNTSGNDTFGDIIDMTYDPSAIGVADDGFTFSFDYTISDLNLQFFISPIALNEGFIFTRLGDSVADGNWEVLETDGLGGGVFFNTGVPIATSGTIEFSILDLAMEISVDGVVIYTGGIIGANGDAGITPGETLTTVDWESINNLAAINAVVTIDNISLNDGCVVAVRSQLVMSTLMDRSIFWT